MYSAALLFQTIPSCSSRAIAPKRVAFWWTRASRSAATGGVREPGIETNESTGHDVNLDGAGLHLRSTGTLHTEKLDNVLKSSGSTLAGKCKRETRRRHPGRVWLLPSTPEAIRRPLVCLFAGVLLR